MRKRQTRKRRDLSTTRLPVNPRNRKVILEEPIEEWPLCDVLLSWHSDGFPLRKAQAYAALRRPFLVNDVGMQDLLLDRRRVYKLLQARILCRVCVMCVCVCLCVFVLCVCVFALRLTCVLGLMCVCVLKAQGGSGTDLASPFPPSAPLSPPNPPNALRAGRVDPRAAPHRRVARRPAPRDARPPRLRGGRGLCGARGGAHRQALCREAHERRGPQHPHLLPALDGAVRRPIGIGIGGMAVRTHTHAHMHIHTHTHMHTHMHTHIHIHVCACACVCVRVCVYLDGARGVGGGGGQKPGGSRGRDQPATKSRPVAHNTHTRTHVRAHVHTQGGGVKRLFRKVENRSADYDPSHPGNVRREGSYIYEQFLPTGGTDVKVRVVVYYIIIILLL